MSPKPKIISLKKKKEREILPSTFKQAENMRIFCRQTKKSITWVCLRDLDFCTTTCLFYSRRQSQCVNVMSIQNHVLLLFYRQT